jgi:beta-1,4-mannosyltransferase
MRQRYPSTMTIQMAPSGRDVGSTSTPRPGWTPFALGLLGSLVILAWFGRHQTSPGFVSWYATIVWTTPLPIIAQGIVGGWSARRRWRHTGAVPGETASPCPQALIVVLPTVGRWDTLAGLTRVLDSLSTQLPRYFDRVRIDVVIEERCEALSEIARRVGDNPLARVVVVPDDFRTPNGTRFKARANHYGLRMRSLDGEADDDTWILHMDDDTGISGAAAERLAAFVNRQLTAPARGEIPRHLAQGILAYPREHSRNWLSWYADAVRPGCDMSFFVATTGRGFPRTGLHGELLLIRARVEAEIGWDFGANSIVEDAQFALLFCERYPGGSEWFPAWCEGASPATIADFVRQRERWVWGLLNLLREAAIPLRRRLILLPNLVVWVLAPFGSPFLVVLVAALVGDLNTSPALPSLGLVWSINYGFYVWLYWEGLAINGRASSPAGRRWWEGPAIVVLTPVFCFLECLGIVSGAAKFVSRRSVHFTVIGKPV